jgi:phosphoglycerol transferase
MLNNEAVASGTVKRGFTAAAVTVLITVIALTVTLRLWRRDLTVPFRYGHDSTICLTWIQAMLDDGWWWTSQRLGAPFHMDTYDFPSFPHLHFAVMKVIALGGFDASTVMNLYFLLSFMLVALAALAALRSLNLSYGACICGAVLYAFLPYHFWRGVSQLFLAAYFMIPLVFLVIIWLFQDRPFLIVRREESRLGLDLRNPRTILSLLICIAIGFDFPYYAAFACVFLLLSGVLAYYAGGTRLTLFRTAILLGVAGSSFLAVVSPHLIYRFVHGPNPSPLHVTKHPWQDGERYGLTVTQMLLPAGAHRVPLLKAVRDKFYASTLLISSEDAMSLGTVGALGLLLALGAAFCCPRSASQRGRVYYLCGMLTIAAILLCTAGGFATLFNLLGTGLAREYSRMSIFIGFLAVALASGVLDDLLARLGRRGMPGAWGWAIPGAVLVLGVADQTGSTYLEPQSQVKLQYDNDAEFVAQVEASVPKGTMVFQYPYLSYFSYHNASHKMLPYDHFRPFLHSHSLRWSFGAMHGRDTDQIHTHIAAQSVPEALRMLTGLGFGGVYVDRLGYADAGRQFENELRRLLGTDPIVSRDERMAFYNLRSYARDQRASGSAAEWSGQQGHLRHPIDLKWGSGFFAEESNEALRWRWCGPHGKLYVNNAADKPQTVTLRFKYRAFDTAPAKLNLSGGLFSAALNIDAAWGEFSRVLTVAPGGHLIALDCTATPYIHPTRTIAFALANVELSPSCSDSQKGCSSSPTLKKSPCQVSRSWGSSEGGDVADAIRKTSRAPSTSQVCCPDLPVSPPTELH